MPKNGVPGRAVGGTHMDYKERLNCAVDYAIETKYCIHNRAIEIKKSLYAHKNVCIFGTGTFFEDCACPEFVERFEYVGDNDPNRWGKKFKGRLCLSPQQIKEMDDIAVLIMIGEWRPVYKQLTEMGIVCYPMDWYMLNAYDSHYDEIWFETNRSKIVNTIDLLEGGLSKEVYTEAICNRIAPIYAKKTFKELEVYGEYFASDVFKMRDDECVVDGGAYRGDSIDEFLRATNGCFERIYSFELDPKIFQELKQHVAKYETDKIELYNAGIADQSTQLEYSYVQGGEKLQTKTVAIDDVLRGKRVTFIKMDVETYELKALEGAKETIRQQKPRLCISAYHLLSDLWEVPLKIKEINSEYTLFMRHHSAVVGDTDCYAFIKEGEK